MVRKGYGVVVDSTRPWLTTTYGHRGAGKERRLNNKIDVGKSGTWLARSTPNREGRSMSDWGFWGYIGIVAGLVLMVAMFLFFMVFMHRAPEARDEEHPTDTKHAA